MLAAGSRPAGGCSRADELLRAAAGARHVLSDKGYDTNRVVQLVADLGAEVVIPSKKTRLLPHSTDRNPCYDRNKVEHFFSRPKQFRRLATRYDKTAASFLSSSTS